MAGRLRLTNQQQLNSATCTTKTSSGRILSSHAGPERTSPCPTRSARPPSRALSRAETHWRRCQSTASLATRADRSTCFASTPSSLSTSSSRSCVLSRFPRELPSRATTCARALIPTSKLPLFTKKSLALPCSRAAQLADEERTRRDQVDRRGISCKPQSVASRVHCAVPPSIVFNMEESALFTKLCRVRQWLCTNRQSLSRSCHVCCRHER